MDSLETPAEIKGDTGPNNTEEKPTKNGTLYDELKQIAEDNKKEEREMETEPSYAEAITKPESRRYGPEDEFIFMVHCPLDIQSRVEALGTEEFTLDERPLNTSLIDSEHSFTFEGMSGLIIAPSPDQGDILGAWGYDSGVNDLQKQTAVAGPQEVLEATRQDDYNQVNVRKGRVVGVFIRIKDDGAEVGDAARNAELRSFAKSVGLPVAEIVVQPVQYQEEPPKTISPQEGLTTTEFSLGGIKFRLDELLADPDRPVAGAEPFEGYYLRVRKVDEYGSAGGDIVDSDSISLILDQLTKIDRSSLTQGQLKALDTHSRFLRMLVNP